MRGKELYIKLQEAWSDQNLNRITAKLIELYKSGNHEQLSIWAKTISEFVSIDSDKASRCFSGLILLYHPDRGELNRKAITQSYQEGKTEEMNSYSHILLLDELVISSIVSLDENIGYHPDYIWDNSCDGFHYFSDSDDNEDNEPESDDWYENSFYNAVKIRMYGNLETEFPAHYLEDFEDVEFSECRIEDLDGIEYCKHARVLDLTGNRISDISDLWTLIQLEELYLSDNQIGYLDSLSNLTNLRVIDLSENAIDDITPLYVLEKLEYLNIVGNKIPVEQINKLREKEIIIMN